jgi:hypothetical protein
MIIIRAKISGNGGDFKILHPKDNIINIPFNTQILHL